MRRWHGRAGDAEFAPAAVRRPMAWAASAVRTQFSLPPYRAAISLVVSRCRR